MKKALTDDALKQIDLMKKALIIRRYDMEEYPYYYEPIKRSITIDPRLFDEFYDANKEIFSFRLKWNVIYVYISKKKMSIIL